MRGSRSLNAHLPDAQGSADHAESSTRVKFEVSRHESAPDAALEERATAAGLRVFTGGRNVCEYRTQPWANALEDHVTVSVHPLAEEIAFNRRGLFVVEPLRLTRHRIAARRRPFADTPSRTSECSSTARVSMPFAGRALAAEFLSPVEEVHLMRECNMDTGMIAGEFGVSEELIERQVENEARIARQRVRRSTVDGQAGLSPSPSSSSPTAGYDSLWPRRATSPVSYPAPDVANTRTVHGEPGTESRALFASR